MRERGRAGLRRAAQGTKGLAHPSLHSAQYLQEYSLGWQPTRVKRNSPDPKL